MRYFIKSGDSHHGDTEEREGIASRGHLFAGFPRALPRLLRVRPSPGKWPFSLPWGIVNRLRGPRGAANPFYRPSAEKERSLSTRKGPGAPVQERIGEVPRQEIVEEIRDSGGNEVFFLGRLDEDLVVRSVQTLARGNARAVPAVSGIAEAGDVVIHNHPNGLLVPSQADLDVASCLGSQGIGFYIVDNACARVYAVVEPQVPEGSPDPLDPGEVAALFGPSGPLAAAHPNYEERPVQGRMAFDTARILESGGVGVLEAGTGTGKSLAYLVPAALWAQKGNRRVVVATRTINLQEQILEQDLPILEDALGTTVKAVLVKGRGNYCCLRKRDMLEGDGGNVLLDLEELREVQQLLAWSRETVDGSVSDLAFVPSEGSWSLLRAESDSCTRARCPRFSECFFYRARLEAASAQLLLANHHILFADLSLRESGHESAAIMPRYDAVILDEAHNVEGVAVSYFDEGVSRRGVMAQLGRLVGRRNPDRGLIPYLRKRVKGKKGPGGKGIREVLELAKTLGEEVPHVRGSMDTLFEDLGETLLTWLAGPSVRGVRDIQDSGLPPTAGGDGPPGNGAARGSSREDTGDSEREFRARIPLFRRNEGPWDTAAALMEEMISLAGQILLPLRKINTRLRDLVDDHHSEFDHVWADLMAVLNRLDASTQFLKRILQGEEPEEVFWIQVSGRGQRRQVALHLTPLDVAPILDQTLFSRVGPVIMTSATLTVGGTFDFFDRQLGIDRLADREVLHEVYATPFDLARQMRLALLDTLPDPGNSGFADALSEAVKEMVLASGGGALVLFTSYRTLLRVHGNCLDHLQGKGYALMRQGEAPRNILLERFRADPDSVLFATDSFWEGIDVVGSSLRLVILARLPFPVPTDPVNEARSEVLVSRGSDPFYEDSVPRAVIRFRQGLGRLIRHRYDRGYAVVCDGRIFRRPYGRVFLHSLGEVPVSRTGLEDLKRDMEAFLYGGQAPLTDPEYGDPKPD